MASSCFAGVGAALGLRRRVSTGVLINSQPKNTTNARNRCEEQCLFVISDYTPTDCNPDTMKDDSYHQLGDLKKVCLVDIVVLEGEWRMSGV